MGIIKEKIKAQRELSKVNVDFLDFVEKTSGGYKRSNYSLLELNNKLFTLQPWPTFINAKSKQMFREASEKLFHLVKMIPKKAFNNDPQKISAYFELPINLVKVQLDGNSDGNLDHLVCRGDFILSFSGLKCLEYNVSVNLGGWDIPHWESLYLRTPFIAEFLKTHAIKIKNENLQGLFLKHVIDSTISRISSGDGKCNMALVIHTDDEIDEDLSYRSSAEVYLNQLYQKVLQWIQGGLTGRLIICDFHQLDLVDGCIFYKEEKIHAVAEMNHGLVSTEIMKAFKAGNICLINGPVTHLLSNKLTLAVLSNYEEFDVFTDEEKEIIDTYVPWTRKIVTGGTTYQKETIRDLEQFMVTNREKLVIKPSQGYGGTGICMGRNVSQGYWQECVRTAFQQKTWLVQELVESVPALYQLGEEGFDYHDIVWGFFVLGPRYTAAWARVMPQKSNKGVINCHQGATVSIIFEVPE